MFYFCRKIHSPNKRKEKKHFFETFTKCWLFDSFPDLGGYLRNANWVCADPRVQKNKMNEINTNQFSSTYFYSVSTVSLFSCYNDNFIYLY